MTQRLMPYGSAEQVQNIARVGTPKKSLAACMPLPDVAAKVGNDKNNKIEEIQTRRLVRRNAQG